jgi:broad specificity phosphatase PhoE
MGENNVLILYLKGIISLYLSLDHTYLMRKISLIFLCVFLISRAFCQTDKYKEIKDFQMQRFRSGECLDFIRNGDISGLSVDELQQIIIIRHGEPAMNKKGWKNRKEAIAYTEMYDAVGVYVFEKKPICLRAYDIPLIYTSRLPRAINTAEKTIEGELPIMQLDLFNEFERKIIKFPNIKLPMKFWSVSTRMVWIIGFNHQGIESFREAKERAQSAASYLIKKAERDSKTVLFAHGFLNKYIKKYLKKNGYEAINLNGHKYLGAYYFYKIIQSE